MNAVTAFEHRRDQLREQLEAAQDMQQAVLACTMALEQAACELAQDEQDERARQRQQAVMAVVRRVPAMLTTCRAEAELLVKEEEAAPQGALDRLGRALQLAGVFALTGLAVYAYISGRTGLAMLQALGTLAFAAGGLRVPGAAQGDERLTARGVSCIDAQAAVAQLGQLCEAVDICVSDLALLETENGRARLTGSADEAMLDLLVSLMEAKQSGRNEAAMRSLDLAEEYLRLLGVDIVAYDETHAAMFDALPTMGKARTVRPALIKDGKLLRRGVAAVAMAERSAGV